MPKNIFRRLAKQSFIIINVIVAILFLLGCYGYLFNPQYFWPIGFLTLTSFYFPLALLVFLILWLFIKRARALISVIAILLAYKPVLNIIPFNFSSAFTTAKQADALRMMSWNVAQFSVLDVKKHPEKKSRMLDLVNEYRPDIACFQEMVAE
ncbi:MAG TPA: hypothetical protein VK484_04310, partial [Ferruginibacter sp.]|nr:hypothetical protein [Ferruginibacter sp.]